MITDLKYWSSSMVEDNNDENDIRRIISVSRENFMNVHDEESLGKFY